MDDRNEKTVRDLARWAQVAATLVQADALAHRAFRAMGEAPALAQMAAVAKMATTVAFTIAADTGCDPEAEWARMSAAILGNIRETKAAP